MEHIGAWSVNNFTLEARKSTTKNTSMFAREHLTTQDAALGLAVRGFGRAIDPFQFGPYYA